MNDPEGRVSSSKFRHVVSFIEMSVPRASNPSVGSLKSGVGLSRTARMMQVMLITEMKSSTRNGRRTSSFARNIIFFMSISVSLHH